MLPPTLAFAARAAQLSDLCQRRLADLPPCARCRPGSASRLAILRESRTDSRPARRRNSASASAASRSTSSWLILPLRRAPSPSWPRTRRPACRTPASPTANCRPSRFAPCMPPPTSPAAIQTGHRRFLRLIVHAHAAHHVVARRPDFHRRRRDIHIRQLLELVVHAGQLLLDVLGRAPRGDIEKHAAVRRAAAFANLAANRPGHHVARQQLRRPPRSRPLVGDRRRDPLVRFLFRSRQTRL